MLLKKLLLNFGLLETQNFNEICLKYECLCISKKKLNFAKNVGLILVLKFLY
jgi:hypothetical protein